ncbi:heat shock 70 kDa protein-like [Histomonas meleagridis]|uniref:heat shock 70 kDa protein-like n=1 Tax=Histomonas meleagridis TaxID=135588 RepID=UPI003559F2C9|nr:heat shock 70 kDa protein-like [Histomonas meleagridis]KAH0806105.1 heat shock 70 kDa protein-like [Histomonas meleagridis]
MRKRSEPKKHNIGIDFGTTYSSICIWENGRAEILTNNNGNFSTPSYVSIQESDLMVVGQPAKDQAALYPKSTIYDSKRMIGRTYNDPCIQDDIKHWPFTVICGQDGMPMIEVQLENEPKKLYSAIQISSFILNHMKSIADDYLTLDPNDTIDAVITVPAYYNTTQREAIMEAGKLAKINVLRTIDEPTAAAIAYGLKDPIHISKKVLIFDFGGGTLDLSLLKIMENNFEVLATSGDTHLGGQDFDNNLVEYFAELFDQEFKCNIHEDKRALHLLRIACEKAKIILSQTTNATISIASLHKGIDYMKPITRAQFDEINREIFERMLLPIDDILNQLHIQKKDIDEIILIGGTSRIPQVRKTLSDFFNGKILTKNIDPEKAVVQGAAIDAANDQEFPIINITSVVPRSIGLEINQGDMDVIIERGTKIPFTARPTYYAPIDSSKQTVEIKVFAGENKKTNKNDLLGKFRLTGLKRPNNNSDPKIEVVLAIDKNGLLKITGKDVTGGASGGVSIKVEKILCK